MTGDNEATFKTVAETLEKNILPIVFLKTK